MSKKKTRVVFSLEAAEAVCVLWHVHECAGAWTGSPPVRLTSWSVRSATDYIVCVCQDKGIAEFLVGHHNANQKHTAKKVVGSA